MPTKSDEGLQTFGLDDVPYLERTKTWFEDGHPDDAEAFLEDQGTVGEFDLESPTARASTRWRPAACLIALRDQLKEAHPNRDTSSDGTIGDMNHCPGSSDHCPNIKDGDVGVVTAIDITHDPANGCDCEELVKSIRASRDDRVKYIIWNRRICNFRSIGGAEPWAWRDYRGRNPHTRHSHFSVRPEKNRYDDTAFWAINGDGSIA